MFHQSNLVFIALNKIKRLKWLFVKDIAKIDTLIIKIRDNNLKYSLSNVMRPSFDRSEFFEV
jgi:hypothetical protein